MEANLMQKGPLTPMKSKKPSLLYRIFKCFVRLFSPKMEVIGAENLPEEPSLVVANHAQMYGPIACELYFPANRYTWCAGEMMHLREVPAYAYADFWSRKPKGTRWFYRILSHLIAPISVCVFNNAQTIPVYHDTRIITTFRETIRRLREGGHVVVFPEHDEPHNQILHDFQDKFIDIARFYYKKTGRRLSFVPMYIAPYLKKMVMGAPIEFRPDAPMDEERARIRTYLMETITNLAQELPPHRVVPYPNIPKKDYPRSIPAEDKCHEKNAG